MSYKNSNARRHLEEITNRFEGELDSNDFWGFTANGCRIFYRYGSKTHITSPTGITYTQYRWYELILIQNRDVDCLLLEAPAEDTFFWYPSLEEARRLAEWRPTQLNIAADPVHFNSKETCEFWKHRRTFAEIREELANAEMERIFAF